MAPWVTNNLAAPKRKRMIGIKSIFEKMKMFDKNVIGWLIIGGSHLGFGDRSVDSDVAENPNQGFAVSLQCAILYP